MLHVRFRRSEHSACFTGRPTAGFGLSRRKELRLRCIFAGIRPSISSLGFACRHGSGAAVRRCWRLRCAVSFAWMSASYQQSDRETPSWDGDPATYAAFETACRWYILTLKESFGTWTLRITTGRTD